MTKNVRIENACGGAGRVIVETWNTYPPGRGPAAVKESAHQLITPAELKNFIVHGSQYLVVRTPECEPPAVLSLRPIMDDVIAELNSARESFPLWPEDPLHAVAILNEEVGELNKAILQIAYEPHKASPDDVRKEAVQVAAMALRFIHNLGQCRFDRSPQLPDAS
jgi:NTP pyrophosphatase (non-canonical NTP hydrolase)